MMLLTMYSMIIMVLVTIMALAPIFLGVMMKKWSEKHSSFECGMSLNSATRVPFSLQFFLLMVLFLIFDIEIALILAVPMLMPWSNQMMLFLMMFITILLNGLIYEWMEGSLNWKL